MQSKQTLIPWEFPFLTSSWHSRKMWWIQKNSDPRKSLLSIWVHGRHGRGADIYMCMRLTETTPKLDLKYCNLSDHYRSPEKHECGTLCIIYILSLHRACTNIILSIYHIDCQLYIYQLHICLFLQIIAIYMAKGLIVILIKILFNTNLIILLSDVS